MKSVYAFMAAFATLSLLNPHSPFGNEVPGWLQFGMVCAGALFFAAYVDTPNSR